MKNQIEDEDFSSEEIKVYKPVAEDKDKLEVDERVYNLLEHIELDWPSQTLAYKDNILYLATNSNGFKQPSLIAIDLEDTDFKNLSFKKKSITQEINRMRLGENLVAVSDNFITTYSKELKMLKSIKGDYSYGLFINDSKIVAGTQNGKIQIFDLNLELISEFKIHQSSIECICVLNDLIYTASSDGTVNITDFSGKSIKSFSNEGVDVNCLDIIDKTLVFGDDNGVITIVHEDDRLEKIEWHKSPIEMIKWKDSEIFASGSEEQLCFWDITLEDEWDFHKYLLFVHQGQQFYKDIAFEENVVITTTQHGISIFEPVSFSVLDSEESE